MWRDSKPPNGSWPIMEITWFTSSRPRREPITISSVRGGMPKTSQFLADRAAYCAWLAVVFLFPASAAEIPRDTHLLLRMVNSITTKTAQAGDVVYMQTASPIVAGD